MLKLFLWLRYLRKRKIVLLSIAAVGLSVGLLIVVDSLFSGYIEGMQKVTVADRGDIYIWPRGKAIPKYDSFLKRLEELGGVEAAAPFNYGGGLLWLESGDVREVVIQGIEPGDDVKFSNWKEWLVRQKGAEGQLDFKVEEYPDDDGCWLGINLAAEPNEKTDEYDLEQIRGLIGKQVVLTTIGAGNKRKVEKLRVADIAITESYLGDQALYLPLSKFNAITYGNDEAQHTWATKIKLRDGVDAEVMKAELRGLWDWFASEQIKEGVEVPANLYIITAEEERGVYFAELHKQRAMLLLIFGVICSVVVVLIFCIFYMIVITRQTDIEVIKSCGATSGSVVAIFIGFGSCVGLVGSGVGIILGYVVTRNINTLEEWVRIIFGMNLWRASSYLLNKIPNEVNWPTVWPIVLVAVIGCCLGAVIPAIVAARTKPVEILRYE